MRFVNKLLEENKGTDAGKLIRKTFETTDYGDFKQYLEGGDERPFKVRRTAGYVEVGLDDSDATIEKVLEALEYLKQQLQQRKNSASK